MITGKNRALVVGAARVLTLAVLTLSPGVWPRDDWLLRLTAVPSPPPPRRR